MDIKEVNEPASGNAGSWKGSDLKTETIPNCHYIGAVNIFI
jgi:hypothetical protein